MLLTNRLPSGEFNYIDSAPAALSVEESAYIDLHPGQKRVVKKDGVFYAIERTVDGYNSCKLSEGQLPFILRGGYGNSRD